MCLFPLLQNSTIRVETDDIAYRLTNAFIEYTLPGYVNTITITCWFVDCLANVDFVQFVDFVDFDI